ncbi:hypothetical protein WN943_000028 [Citrus x changshan-huyou]
MDVELSRRSLEQNSEKTEKMYKSYRNYPQSQQNPQRDTQTAPANANGSKPKSARNRSSTTNPNRPGSDPCIVKRGPALRW